MTNGNPLNRHIAANPNLSAPFEDAMNGPMSWSKMRKAARLLLSLDKWMGGGLKPEQKATIYRYFPDIRPMSRAQLAKAQAKRASKRA